MTRIYKILPRADWLRAEAAGIYAGSPDDLRDGFIHFSTATQTRESASRHFRGQAGLVVLEVDSAALGETIKWEPSRGGALFPHLYAPLRIEDVEAVTAAPLDADGVPDPGPLRA